MNYDFFRKDKSTKDGFSRQCKECINARESIYRENHREERNHPEKRYYQKNKEYYSKKNAEYKRNNRDKYNVMEQRREANKRNLINDFTNEQWNEVK